MMPNETLLSQSLPSLDSDAPAAIEAVLRRAELARTNNFDLLQQTGYQALRIELAADFPYLTLADLNAIIKLGIKGKLDTYKARTLNFTRVYQWVEQRAVFSLGYWQAKHPVLMEWAGQVGIATALLAEIDTYETPAAAFAQPHKMRQLLQNVLLKSCFPTYRANDYVTMDMITQFPVGASHYGWVEHVAYPAFIAQHPEQANQNTPLF